MKSCFAKHHHGRLEFLGKRGSQFTLFDTREAKLTSAQRFLSEKYEKSFKTYRELVEENIAETDFLHSDFHLALKEMEKEGKIYIERRPPFTPKAKRPRTSIEEHDYIYFNDFPSIHRKTLLYKTKVEYGNFTINHVFGCAHGCNYPCYARMMAQGYGKVKTYNEWLNPRIVGNALQLLEKEIPKFRHEIDFVHLSFTTDPFMYDAVNKRLFPEIRDLTLSIISKLHQNGISTTILTKGLFPEELAKKPKYGTTNRYGITLVSLNDKFRKQYEPYSAPFKQRVNSLRYLHEKGLRTWASIEPYPTPNIVKQDLSDLLEKLSFVDNLIFGKMNYNRSANGYPESERFYSDCVATVKDFCKERGIAYHIKEGTPGSEASTVKIFSGCDVTP